MPIKRPKLNVGGCVVTAVEVSWAVEHIVEIGEIENSNKKASCGYEELTAKLHEEKSHWPPASYTLHFLGFVALNRWLLRELNRAKILLPFVSVENIYNYYDE